MVYNREISKSASKGDEPYHKGERIFYKGEEAQIIEVKPIFTIKIKDKSHLICGNILDEIRLS